MFGNFVLYLAFLTYAALLIFNLDKGKGTGDQMVSYLYVGFVIIAAYIVLSLILTIILTSHGSFNWISSSTFWRNLGVGLLWLGMIAGIVACICIRTVVQFGDKLHGSDRVFGLLIYYGGVWLPLLMLVPYSIMLHPQWIQDISPNVLKIPLLFACSLGILVSITFRKTTRLLADKSPQYEFNNTIKKIYRNPSVIFSLYYVRKDEDERLRFAALNRIKQLSNYEDEFQMIFEEDLVQSFYGIYTFWDEYKVEHPDRFVQLLNKSISSITSEISEQITNPYKGDVLFEVGILCRVLDKHFKNNSPLFKPNMHKLLQVLEIKPTNRFNGNTKNLEASLRIGFLEVKNWLETLKTTQLKNEKVNTES